MSGPTSPTRVLPCSRTWRPGAIASCVLTVGAWDAACAQNATPAATLPSVLVTARPEPAGSLSEEAQSASRLGLSVRDTPASIDVIPQAVMRERGIRSVSEAALGAIGVTAGDFPAEPANFSMRGFGNSLLNTLYNGIKIGPPNMTSRVMDAGNLERIEFLKGSASLMSGEGASGGAVNLITKRPHRGQVRNELDLSVGSFGTVRSGFGSGGTSAIDELDYRFDLYRTASDGFVNDTASRGWHLSAGVDWHARPGLKVFGAVEFKKDRASSYWGTPLVSVAATGANSADGIVSGTYVSGFNGTDLGAVTLDRRTLRTNYNVLDNRNTADESWLRGGFDWRIEPSLVLRTQFYRYAAEREWFNNEVTAFNAVTGLVDRERFFVGHDQTTVGNKTELQWDARVAGRDNQLVAALEWSDIDFGRPGAANFPGDSVSLIDPDRGLYGLLTTARQTAAIRNLAFALEDRLKLTPAFALILGVRTESIDLERSSANAAGVSRPGFPFAKTWRPTTGRVGATWDASPTLTLYGQVATGTDVAANNLFLLRANQPLELTRTRTTEIGLKQSLPRQRGAWTVALYDIERGNVYAAQGGRALALAGATQSRGAEFGVSLDPAPNWRVWGNLALNRTRYERYDFAGGSFSGNTPPNAPPVVANAGASYRFAAGVPFEVGGMLRHVGERQHSDANTVRLAAYTVADASIAADVMPRTRVMLRVRNLADRRYAIWSDPFYPDQILLGAPRSVELSLRHEF